MTHTTDAQNPDLVEASAQNKYEVRRDELPLSCPTPGQRLWNAHPRVFLPIEDTGSATCPYCSAHYTLID